MNDMNETLPPLRLGWRLESYSVKMIFTKPPLPPVRCRSGSQVLYHYSKHCVVSVGWGDHGAEEIVAVRM